MDWFANLSCIRARVLLNCHLTLKKNLSLVFIIVHCVYFLKRKTIKKSRQLVENLDFTEEIIAFLRVELG